MLFGHAEGLAEVFVEGVEVDVFDGCGVEVLAVEFAATLGLADVNPVGGAIACSLETLAFDECLKKDGFVCVARVPVFGQLLGGGGEDLGREGL